MVNLVSNLCTCEDNLAADEDQENNLRLDHAVDETRKQLRFIGTEVVVTRGETLEANGELDVAGTDDVLDFEVGELGVETWGMVLVDISAVFFLTRGELTKLLDDTSILATGKFGIILRLRASNHHLARSEDQSGCLGLTNTHDDSSKTLRVYDMVSWQLRTPRLRDTHCTQRCERAKRWSSSPGGNPSLR